MAGSIRIALLGFVVITLAGCSVLGGEDESPTFATADVCDDRFNEFVSQDSDGIGVMAEQCSASERGQWIVGEGCYCHGEGDL